jgi:hypothetical protein
MKRGGCSAKVSKGRIVFSGPSGEHSLDVSVSGLDRIIKHWQGFLSNNGVELKPGLRGLVALDDYDGGGTLKLVIGRLNGQFTRRPRYSDAYRAYHVRRLRADGTITRTNTHLVAVDEVAAYLI